MSKMKNSTAVNNEVDLNTSKVSRRSAIKALAGIPIVGLLGFKVFDKIKYNKNQELKLVRELGLYDMKLPVSDFGNSDASGDLIRIGIIGFGARATALASALGFLHPNVVTHKMKNNTFQQILNQEFLNVAITGICDVFDVHAEKGMLIASNSVFPEKQDCSLPVKRYKTYKEMLCDKDIDAVVIATPDHHHACMAVEATKAGKHIYLEKSVALTEEELNELYWVVKNSNITFQLGHQITQSAVFQQAKEIIGRNVLGKITLIETTSNRNTSEGAWIRHTDSKGNPKPGDERSIDWRQWIGHTPHVPFSIDRFYNWTKWFDYNTGLIGQLFTHEFDAVNQLLRIGIPTTVVSSGGIYFWKDGREMPDTLHCVFEYPNKDLTLTYSGSLASGRNRGRILMGHDASMELGSDIKIIVDRDSTQYKQGIVSGIIDPTAPVLSFNHKTTQLDGVTSASEKYYTTRGLSNTRINGLDVDVTHLHMREWIHCIREKKQTSANIEMAYEEGIACIMAHRSYVEKRQVRWDDKLRRIL
jgi:predicted dehydrogenase